MPGREQSDRTCYGHSDRLLLHRFMVGCSVFIAHLVILIDVNHSSVGENHCSAVKMEFALSYLGLSYIKDDFERCIKTGSR